MQDSDFKKQTKRLFAVVTYGIVLFMLLVKFDSVKNAFSWIFAILEPVIYGVVIAFIINIIMNIFRHKVYYHMAESEKRWEKRLCGVFCAVSTTVVVAIIIALIVFFIVPQVKSAVETLIEKLPTSQEQLLAWIDAKLIEWKAPPSVSESIHKFQIDWDEVIDFFSNLLDGKVGTVLDTAFSATASVITAIANVVVGFIIAIYILVQKDRVLRVLRKLLELFIPARFQDEMFRVLQVTNRSFSNFLTGQMIEAVIFGTLCTIGLAIFRFPYAVTIGVLTGITALLPIIGAWIGAIVGSLLVWVEAPDKVIWFLVFILLLQQIEGHFIYPKVVGESIGLPGLLVLIAVIVGGGMNGIMGIFIAVPIFAIIFTLLKDAVDKKDREKAAALAAEGPPLTADGASGPTDTPESAAQSAIESEPAGKNGAEGKEPPKKPRFFRKSKKK